MLLPGLEDPSDPVRAAQVGIIPAVCEYPGRDQCPQRDELLHRRTTDQPVEAIIEALPVKALWRGRAAAQSSVRPELKEPSPHGRGHVMRLINDDEVRRPRGGLLGCPNHGDDHVCSFHVQPLQQRSLLPDQFLPMDHDEDPPSILHRLLDDGARDQGLAAAGGQLEQHTALRGGVVLLQQGTLVGP